MKNQKTLTREDILQSIALNTPIEEVTGENVEQLVELVLKNNALGIAFDWQPAAYNLTPDQRAAEVLKWQKQINEYQALPTEEKLRLQIRDTYIALHNVIEECALDVEKLVNKDYSQEELVNRLRVIFHTIDLELMSLRNWVPREIINEIFERKKKARG